MDLETTVKEPLPAGTLRATAPIKAVAGSGRTWSRRRRFIRLHGMEGGISKVYPIQPSRLEQARILKLFDPERIGNVYCEQQTLARRLKGGQDTLWHALVPLEPA